MRTPRLRSRRPRTVRLPARDSWWYVFERFMRGLFRGRWF